MLDTSTQGMRKTNGSSTKRCNASPPPSSAPSLPSSRPPARIQNHADKRKSNSPCSSACEGTFGSKCLAGLMLVICIACSYLQAASFMSLSTFWEPSIAEEESYIPAYMDGCRFNPTYLTGDIGQISSINSERVLNRYDYYKDNEVYVVNESCYKPQQLTRSQLATLAVIHRQAIYERNNAQQTFLLRGIGHLYIERKIVLMAESEKPHEDPGFHSIKVYNVYDPRDEQEDSPVWRAFDQMRLRRPSLKPSMMASGSSATTSQDSALRNDCHRLTIWMRVMGKEIFAGNAIAVNATDTEACHWEFPVHLQLESRYEIDAKVIMWDRHHSESSIQANAKCNTETVLVGDQFRLAKGDWRVLGPTFKKVMARNNNAILHQGFKGFKLYHPDRSCCQICARMKPYCIYFLTPPLHMNDTNRLNNGCELFYRHDTPDHYILKSRFVHQPRATNMTQRPKRGTNIFPALPLKGGVALSHGTPYPDDRPLFLGCGWSNWHSLDFPCLSGALDDRVFIPYRYFGVAFEQDCGGTACGGHDTALMDSEDSTTAIAKRRQDGLPPCTLEHEKVSFDPRKPSGRWMRFDFNDTHLCPFPFDFAIRKYESRRIPVTSVQPTHPKCWHRGDFREFGNFCAEMNCQFIDGASQYRSSLHNESEFMGVYRNYACNYMEYTLAQRQECITKRKITGISTNGRSMAAFYAIYLKSMVEGIDFYKDDSADQTDGLHVILSSASYAHRIVLPMDVARERFRKRSEHPMASERVEVYSTTSSYLSSERDTNAHLGSAMLRERAFGEILEQELGHKLLNFMEPSQAFTFDTAAQHDGLHIAGPPMKMVITKLFHHMCHEVVNGGEQL